MHYDDALNLVGGCGRYQILVFFLMSIICMKAAIEIQLLVVATYTPSFSCVWPYNSTNSTESRCHADGMPNVTCSSWSYDTSLVDRTMATEFNLVCDREYLQPLYMTLVLISIMFGRMIGLTCDIFGRRPIYLIVVGYDLIMTPIQAFLPSFEAVFALRMLRGLGDGVLFTSYTYLLEFVSVKYRAMIGGNYWICYCIGYGGTSLLGYFLRDWRYIQVAACFVVPAYIIQCIFMLESPRWLLVRGRQKEAAKTLVKIARMNGKKNVTYERLKNVYIEEDVNTGRLRDCFSTRQMALKTSLMAVIMWATSFSYFGLSLDGKIASSNIFISIALMGLFEIFCSPLGWVIGDKLGRKWPSVVLFIVTGIIILVIPHLPVEGSVAWVRAVAAVSGKIVQNTAFVLVLIFITEVQPTCIRYVSLLPSLILISLGAIMAPLVLHQAVYGYWIPSIIIAVWCFFGAAAMIPLPETRGLPLTQTVEEADLLVSGQEHLFKARLQEHRSKREKKTLMDEINVVVPQNVIV